VTGSKAVKEVQERHACLERRGVGDRGEIGRLLNTARAQHRESGCAGCHHVAVVAEDAECMRGDSSGRHVDDRWCEFAGNLEHVRQHQQQSLAGCERRAERAASDRAV
jgi:hypothetical protein